MQDLISNPLYQAVLTNPDDDLPRLVLADWLDEQGDTDRADFIRTQIELAKWPEKTRRDFDTKAQAEARRRLGRLRGQDRDRVMNDAITIGRESYEQHTARRKELIDRQMRLLWGNREDGGSNWERWCWAAARDQEGMPIRGEGRGGMVITPHASGGLEGEPTRCGVPLPDGGVLYQAFRRGFVDEVECPIHVWVGDYCLSCDGVGDDGGRDYSTEVCGTCKGTGDGVRLGNQIVRQHPVTKFVNSPRDPVAHLQYVPFYDSHGRPGVRNQWVILSDYWDLDDGLETADFGSLAEAEGAVCAAALRRAKCPGN